VSRKEAEGDESREKKGESAMKWCEGKRGQRHPPPSPDRQRAEGSDEVQVCRHRVPKCTDRQKRARGLSDPPQQRSHQLERKKALA